MAIPKSVSAWSTARLAAVRSKHAIAEKTPAVANQHAHLAESLRQLHARGDHFL
jgi:hypothetical protein